MDEGTAGTAQSWSTRNKWESPKMGRVDDGYPMSAPGND